MNKNIPKRHIDVGSRVGEFVLIVASYREIEVIDNSVDKNKYGCGIYTLKKNYINIY